MTIYSWEGEDLWEHSLLEAEAGRCLFPDEAELYNKKVSQLAGREADWWALTALLHDVGKAHRAFQRPPYKSFKCYEVYSATFAYRVLMRYGEAAHAVALAVLLHRRTEDVNRCLNAPPFDPVEELSEYVSKVSNKVGVEIDAWRFMPVREALKYISNRNAYKTALIAVLPLVIGDAVASYSRDREAARIAAEAAREHPTRFAKCAHIPAVRAILDSSFS
jgi:CRISPR/Cas system-associated endonuclease Cas3-HD